MDQNQTNTPAREPIAPETQHVSYIGKLASGKSSALALTLAQLTASGTPHEVGEEDEYGKVEITIRPATASDEQEG